jgi:hypothetical protein
MEVNLHRIYKLIEALRYYPSSYSRLAASLTNCVSQNTDNVPMKHKAGIVLIGSNQGSNFIQSNRNYNTVISDITRNIDRIDEPSVLILNEALQQNDISHF